MTKQFKIFKPGKTSSGKITILSKIGEPFDRDAKIRKFLSLGYFVYEMNDDLIA